MLRVMDRFTGTEITFQGLTIYAKLQNANQHVFVSATTHGWSHRSFVRQGRQTAIELEAAEAYGHGISRHKDPFN